MAAETVIQDAKAPAKGSRILARYLPLAGVVLAVSFPFYSFFLNASYEWIHNPSFSHGICIPFITAWLLYERREKFSRLDIAPSLAGLAPIIVGCVLHVMGTLSGILMVSGVGLMLTLLGAVALIWGPLFAKRAIAPISLLLWMVPWPSYMLGGFYLGLKHVATIVSATLLQQLGVTVYQDGNLLVLPQFVLEIRDACSGTRSVFAMIALAMVLAILMKASLAWRVLLVSAAPVMAVASNIVRIVGTAVAAQWFGPVAAKETLHVVWGVVVFVLATGGLLLTKMVLQWASCRLGS